MSNHFMYTTPLSSVVNEQNVITQESIDHTSFSRVSVDL